MFGAKAGTHSAIHDDADCQRFRDHLLGALLERFDKGVHAELDADGVEFPLFPILLEGLARQIGKGFLQGRGVVLRRGYQLLVLLGEISGEFLELLERPLALLLALLMNEVLDQALVAGRNPLDDQAGPLIQLAAGQRAFGNAFVLAEILFQALVTGRDALPDLAGFLVVGAAGGEGRSRHGRHQDRQAHCQTRSGRQDTFIKQLEDF